LSLLSPDDTLLIRSGVYAEAMTGIPGGISGHVITVAGYPGEGVTIQPPVATTANAVVYCSSAGKKYITVNSLVLDAVNIGGVGSCVSIGTGSGSTGGTSTNITVTNCTIKNSPTDGVHISGASDNCTVSGCTILSNGGAANAGIVTSSANNTFTNNDVNGNLGYAISISYDGTHAAGGNTVSGNKLHDGGKNGVFCNTGTGNTIFNNLVYNNTHAGIIIAAGSTSPPVNTTVYFNSLYGNNSTHSDGAALAIDGGTGAIVENNISFNSASNLDYRTLVSPTADYNCTKDASATGAHSLPSTDPKFTNPGAQDFTLQLTSPCKGTGLTIGGITVDYAGTTRASPPSMGAYE
jgi:parallel beta-helix repeat protein